MTIQVYPALKSQVTSNLWRYTATGGETTLTGVDNAGTSLYYYPNQELVYLNGILLVRGVDYTATSGTSITGLAALAAGDYVQVNCYSNFTITQVPVTSLQGSVQNLQLANSSITIGGQTISLGGTLTTPTGLTLSGATNTFSNIPNSALTNSSIIINGQPISLGGTVNITTPNTILSQKGDLIVASSLGTATNLPVGADGTTLVANSASATGVAWRGFVGVLVQNSVGLTSTNSAYTTITADTNIFDTSNFHNTTTNTSRLTVPTGLAGYYEITLAAIHGGSSSTGARIMRIMKNGNNILSQGKLGNETTTETQLTLSYITYLNVADYIEFAIYQNSGANGIIYITPTFGWMGMKRLGS
jgi:hypothetical protein